MGPPRRIVATPPPGRVENTRISPPTTKTTESPAPDQAGECACSLPGAPVDNDEVTPGAHGGAKGVHNVAVARDAQPELQPGLGEDAGEELRSPAAQASKLRVERRGVDGAVRVGPEQLAVGEKLSVEALGQRVKARSVVEMGQCHPGGP